MGDHMAIKGAALKAPETDLKRRQPVLLARRVYESMLADIITGELEPGQFLTEAQLAERYQASRTPVREACIHLRNEHLLRPIRRKGYQVVEITLDDIREIYEILEIVEPELAALAASN